MQGFFRFFLLRTFLEARALTSEAKLDNLGNIRHVFLTLGDNTLHVAALSTDQAACHLELALVRDLNVIAARILCLVIGTAIALVLLHAITSISG